MPTYLFIKTKDFKAKKLKRLNFQVFGNEDTSCPERSGGRNVSRLYIDSSEPSPGGTGKWTRDDSLTFECYSESYKPVACPCKTYKVPFISISKVYIAE